MVSHYRIQEIPYKEQHSIKYVNNKDLLYSTGNYTHYHVITYKGK